MYSASQPVNGEKTTVLQSNYVPLHGFYVCFWQS